MQKLNSTSSSLSVVVMAAGKGTRMNSPLPKVLHSLDGRTLVGHVLAAAQALNADTAVVVTGHGAAEVEQSVGSQAADYPGLALRFVRQEPQLGTGHAVQQAVPVLPDEGVVVILSGDVPLIEVQTLQDLVSACNGTRLALLTVEITDPTGYGRVIRDRPEPSGQDVARIQSIVEHKDATPAQLAVTEGYSGIMAAPAGWLKASLSRLTNHNAQKEYYLTDVVKMAVEQGLTVVASKIDDVLQVTGVNTAAQLVELEQLYLAAKTGEDSSKKNSFAK